MARIHDRAERIAVLMSEGRSHDEIAALLDITPRRLYQVKAEKDKEISAAIAAIDASDREGAIEQGVTVRRAMEIRESGGAFAREMAGLAARHTPESIEMLVEIRDNPDARTQDKLRAIEQLTRIAGLSTEFVARSLEVREEQQTEQRGLSEESVRVFKEQILGLRPE